MSRQDRRTRPVRAALVIAGLCVVGALVLVGRGGDEDGAARPGAAVAREVAEGELARAPSAQADARSDAETQPAGEPKTTEPEAAVAMRPGLRVVGRVTDARDGAPAVGAEVRWVAYAREDAPVRATTTGAAGAFAFEEVEDGGYRLEVRASPTHALLVRTYFLGERTPRAEDGAVDLGELLVREGSLLRGEVVSSGGARLTYPAQLFVFEGGPTRVRGAAARKVGETDGAGRFALEEPVALETAGTSLLAACEEGLGWVRLGELGAERLHDEMLRVEVLDGPAATIHVVDEAGAPVEGARVSLISRLPALQGVATFAVGGESELLRGLVQRTTDADGAVRFRGLPAEEDAVWSAELRAEGFALRMLPRLTLAEREQTFVLAPERRPTVLRGAVTGEEGGPIEGARVQLVASDAHALTDARGAYELELPPRFATRVAADCSAPGRATERGRVEVVEGTEPRLDFVLAPGHSIEGRVVDERGVPLAGVSLQLASVGGRPRVSRRPDGPGVTGEDGAFVFSSLPMASYALRASGPDARYTRWTELRVTAGDRDVVLVRARLEGEPCRLIVRCSDVGGAPVVPLDLHVLPASEADEAGLPEPRLLAERDDGARELELRAGRWRVWARGPSDEVGARVVELESAGARAETTVTLAAPASLRVELEAAGVDRELTVWARLADGGRAPFWPLWKDPVRTELRQSGRAGEELVLERLAPGAWELGLVGASSDAPTRVELAPGAEARVTLTAD